MPERCSVCHVAYEPEPGFYWGAMFVSYAFSVACFALGGILAYYLFHDPAVWVYILMMTSLVLLTAPATLRYSRAIMLYLFGDSAYDARYRLTSAVRAVSGSVYSFVLRLGLTPGPLSKGRGGAKREQLYTDSKLAISSEPSAFSSKLYHC